MSLSQDLTPRVAVIMGPTGVGKTEVGIEIAQKIGAEIVSADSRQIYKYMDIGTAKPSPEQRSTVAHWMIDCVEPDVDYSAARYSEDATQVIRRLLSQRRRVLIVGGSGLYIQALFDRFFPAPPANPGLRKRLAEEARVLGSQTLHSRLTQVDPEAAHRIHPHDIKRVVRALEIYELTGTPISRLQTEHTPESGFTPLYIGLTRERKEMRMRIEKRVDGMIGKGLVDEVSKILAMGYSPDLNSLNTVGYRETIQYLRGGRSLDETIALIKKNTRAYGKRQLTWLRKVPNVEWENLSDSDLAISRTVKRINEFLHCVN